MRVANVYGFYVYKGPNEFMETHKGNPQKKRMALKKLEEYRLRHELDILSPLISDKDAVRESFDKVDEVLNAYN